MKVLLAGATGFVGSEILKQCIAHNYIQRIYCLTRKPLDPKVFKGKNGHKVTEILHDDYEAYPNSLLLRLKEEGVEACIWALGGNSIAQYKNVDEARRVGINYPIQCAEALAGEVATALSPQLMPKKKFPFRFIFISSWGAEQDQFRSLWIWNDSRKIKGAAEKGLFDIADASQEVQGHKCFEVVSLRPGQVIAAGDAISTLLWEATVPSIAVDRLAKSAISHALMGTGDEKKRIIENKECLGDDWAQVNTFTF
ncbi:hypothetical protein D0864_06551 [Hortaea werneckii]|uniref:NAD(P)-binding domain-containing protein n=1 Tax=Hortaea werneckii TaxID=91943 RepID=A0A3M7FJ63_HORWE|nr:hypothetical protein KC323_g6018 [Hortaea werneckii]KAI6864950.1 hypothetical protein KC338_g5236 [Hortaea werneckii]KAI7352426.1 hypothetical protein KC320_g4470 [Hortaea werneckii]RMY88885.1 hypothetical protein D0864_06551 [Hortaea werneckii]